MSHIEETIAELDKQIQIKQAELQDLQNTANNLCKLLNLPPKYELQQPKNIYRVELKGDEYHRKPMATVITEILQNRRNSQMGPATIDEVHNRMIEGGYIFTVKETKTAVGTALGKNPKFTRLPNDKWGLTEWYGKEKIRKTSSEIEKETIETKKETLNDLQQE